MDLSKPLPPAALHILIALAASDCHGYAILQAVREHSRGKVPLGTGSLYRHLARLVDAGFVTEVDRRRADEDPRRGTHYRITPWGRQALAAERRRLVDTLASIDGFRPASRKGSA
jgi:DNA-binding PadR family transcriptional regulator